MSIVPVSYTHLAIVLGVLDDEATGFDVGGFAAEDFGRGVEGSAALPFLSDEGVPGFRHGAGTPVTGNQERVLVFPGDGLFAVRRSESAIDEAGGF